MNVPEFFTQDPGRMSCFLSPEQFEVLLEEELLPGENRIFAEGLAEGVYSLVLETFTNGHVVKKLVIAR
jgi:hypothetical protein